MTITRQIMLDTGYKDLADAIKNIQTERDLTIFDIENILYRILNDIKSEKELQYSNDIINLASSIQQMQKVTSE